MRNYKFNAATTVIAFLLIGMYAPSARAMQPKELSQADAIHEIQYTASHDAWGRMGAGKTLIPDVVTGIITNAITQSQKFQALKQGVAEAQGRRDTELLVEIKEHLAKPMPGYYREYDQDKWFEEKRTTAVFWLKDIIKESIRNLAQEAIDEYVLKHITGKLEEEIKDDWRSTRLFTLQQRRERTIQLAKEIQTQKIKDQAWKAIDKDILSDIKEDLARIMPLGFTTKGWLDARKEHLSKLWPLIKTPDVLKSAHKIIESAVKTFTTNAERAQKNNDLEGAKAFTAEAAAFSEIAKEIGEELKELPPSAAAPMTTAREEVRTSAGEYPRPTTPPPFTWGAPAATPEPTFATHTAPPPAPVEPLFSAPTAPAAKSKVTEAERAAVLRRNYPLESLDTQVRGLTHDLGYATAAHTRHQEDDLKTELGNAERRLTQIIFPEDKGFDLLKKAVKIVAKFKDLREKQILEELITQLKDSYSKFLQLCQQAPKFVSEWPAGKLTLQEALAKIDQIASGRETPAAPPAPTSPTRPTPAAPEPFPQATRPTTAMGGSSEKKEPMATMSEFNAELELLKVLVDDITVKLGKPSLSFFDLDHVAEIFDQIFFAHEIHAFGQDYLQKAEASVKEANDSVQAMTLAELKSKLIQLGKTFVDKWQAGPADQRRESALKEEEMTQLIALLLDGKQAEAPTRPPIPAHPLFAPQPETPSFPSPRPATEPTTVPESKEAEEEESLTTEEQDALYEDEHFELGSLDSQIGTLEKDIKANTSLPFIAIDIAGIFLTTEEYRELGRGELQSTLAKAESAARSPLQKQALEKLKNKLVRLFRIFETRWNNTTKQDKEKLGENSQRVEKVIQLSKEKISRLKRSTPSPTRPTAPSTFAWGATAPSSPRPTRPSSRWETPAAPLPTSPTLAPSEPFRSPPFFPSPRPATEVSHQEEAADQALLDQIRAIRAEGVSALSRTDDEISKQKRIADRIKSIQDSGTRAQAQQKEGARILAGILKRSAEEIPESFDRAARAKEKRSGLAERVDAIENPIIKAVVQTGITVHDKKILGDLLQKDAEPLTWDNQYKREREINELLYKIVDEATYQLAPIRMELAKKIPDESDWGRDRKTAERRERIAKLLRSLDLQIGRQAKKEIAAHDDDLIEKFHAMLAAQPTSTWSRDQKKRDLSDLLCKFADETTYQQAYKAYSDERAKFAF
ncbi:MAG: hypothetical protein WCW33_06320 [Candidatus Babeliales bacterium]